MELEAGKLYQVKHWEKGWIIAEYVKEVAAHSYKYHNLSMTSLKIVGGEKTRNVPLSHAWRKISWTAGAGSVFQLTAKGMETRPCTEEAIETINSLRADIKRLEEESQAKRRELREFCE